MTVAPDRVAVPTSGHASRGGFPPGPRSRIPGRLPVRLFRNQLRFLEDAKREWGDVLAFRVGPKPVALLSHPDDIRDVLVTQQRHFIKGRGLQRAKRLLGEGLLTSEGDFHLRQRRLAQPAFHRDRITAYAATMIDLASTHAARWTPGATVEIAGEMMRLTLEIAARTLFGSRVEGEAAEIGAAVKVAVESFATAVIPFSELMDHLPFGPGRRFFLARARLDQTIGRMIAARRADGRDHGDLLSMLLAARDEDGDGTGMTDLQIRDEVMTIFLAGHETTANALTWSWWLLARHPEVEARMHAELASVLGDRLPVPDDARRLPYTRAVVAESMRLYPPAWILGRQALRPYQLRGHVLPTGTLVLMSQYLVHRDARWFPDPDRFDPQRWLVPAEEQPERPRLAYFPFGAGTRVCIGEQFAWTEAVLVLATLARRWRLVAHDDRPVGVRALITLRPDRPIPMRVDARAP